MASMNVDDLSSLQAPEPHPDPSVGGIRPPETKIQSPPPSEEVLGNRDLLYHIFLELLPIDEGNSSEVTLPIIIKESRERLLGLALICRAFRDPALDCLWRNIDSLPLIKLLPSLVKIGKNYYFNGVISPSSKFFEYAARVRSLVIGRPPIPDFDPSVYTALAQQFSTTPMLPGLQEIQFLDRDASFSWNIMSLFLQSPSTIRRIEVQGGAFASEEFLDFGFGVIASGIPDLTHLVLTSESSMSGLDLNGNRSSSFWGTLIKFRRLETLDIRLPAGVKPPSDLFRDLGKHMPRLSSLTLDVHLNSHLMTFPSFNISWNPGPLGSFNGLTHFHVFDRRPIGLCGCYSQLPLARKLTNFTIYATTTSSLATFGLTSSIGVLSSYQSLRRIEVKEKGVKLDISVNGIITFLTLKTLEELVVDVSTISLEGGSQYGCGDSLKRLLNAAYGADGSSNNLRLLVLPAKWRERTQSPLLSSLSHVCNIAKPLRHLEVAIASSEYDIGLAVTTHSPASMLRTLTIHDCRIAGQHFPVGDYDRMARFLDDSFPGLDSLKVFTEFYVDSWALVERLRRLLRENRVLTEALQVRNSVI